MNSRRRTTPLIHPWRMPSDRMVWPMRKAIIPFREWVGRKGMMKLKRSWGRDWRKNTGNPPLMNRMQTRLSKLRRMRIKRGRMVVWMRGLRKIS